MTRKATNPAGVVKRTQLIHLDPLSICEVEGRNPRKLYVEIEELATSIGEVGVRNPIKVQKKDGKWNLVDGHRRLRALKQLADSGRKDLTVPAIQIPVEWDEKDILLDMAASNSGKDFKPFEEAELYNRLRKNYKMKVKQIATHVCRSQSHVSDKLALLNADDSVKEAITKGEMSQSDAITVVRKSHGDKDKQKEMTKKAKDSGGKSVQKELRKGRMNKHQWDIAITLSEEFTPSIINCSNEDVKALTTSKNYEDIIKGNNDHELIYRLGQMDAMSKFVNMDIAEFMEAVQKKVSK